MNCNTLMRVISRFYFVHSMYPYVCVLHYICTIYMWQGSSVFTFVCDMLINRCGCVYLRFRLRLRLQLRLQFYVFRVHAYTRASRKTYTYAHILFRDELFSLFYNTYACAFGACAIVNLIMRWKKKLIM